MNRDDLSYQMGQSNGYDEGLADGVRYERECQHKFQWRKLFRTVVYATFIGSFLAFATVYLLVTWL